MVFYVQVVGDTFPVACLWSDNIVYRNETFQANPDGQNPAYNTKLGVYKEKCGIENLILSWGHDVNIFFSENFVTLLSN